MASVFDQLSPYIDSIDYTPQNPYDTGRVTFRCNGDPVTLIKWCRRNFGNRGDGWDFVGNRKTVDISIWSSRLITMYKMWQE